MSYFLPPKVSTSVDQHINLPSETPSAAPPPIKPPQNPKEQKSGQRASSVGNWMKSILPSQRPERGGTYRNQGYWEELKKKGGQPPRRRVTDGYQSVGADSVNSNRIVRWNTAKDLPESLSNPPPPSLPQRRVISAGPESVSSDGRKWSWSREESEDKMSISKLGGILQEKAQIRESMQNITAGTLVSVTSVAGRRQSEVQRVVSASLESRRNRQSLKESGDYLGVQGVNPQTGEMDIMTPTDSTPRSSVSMGTESRLKALQNLLRNNKHIYEKVPTRMTEEEKFMRLQKEKEKAKSVSKSVKWHKRGKQWSSAQEPDLSPITQSLRSASPSSRRQSKGKSPQTNRPLLGRLIDLGSPKSETQSTFLAVPFVDAVLQNTNQDTSNSSGTVVRTPHRQSIAHPSSAAWELFENGITFGPSDNSHASSRNAADISPTATDDPAAPISVTHSLGQQPSTDTLQTPITSPGRAIAKDQGSFLGIRTKRQSDPGDTQESMSFLINATPNVPQTVTDDAMDTPTPPERNRSTANLTSPPSTVGDLEIQSILGRQPLRKAVPHLIYLRKKRAYGNQQEGSSKPRPTPILHWRSVKNPRKGAVDITKNPAAPMLEQETSVLGNSGNQRSPLTKDTTEEEMQMLKLRVVGLDSPESKASIQRITQGATDQDWIDSTIRDMKTKADEVTDLSLSIPTIITTGYDHQTSPLNPKGCAVEEPEETTTRRPRMTRPLSRLIYNLPVTSSSELSLENSPIEPPSNSASSVMSLEQKELAADTISIAMGFPETQGIETLKEPTQGKMTESQHYSTLRKSTSTQHQGVMQGLTQDHQVENQVREPMQQKVTNPETSRRMRIREWIQTQREETWYTEDSTERVPERQPVCLDTELRRLVQCPGRYPISLDGDDEDAIDDHLEISVFEIITQSLQDEIDSFWNRIPRGERIIVPMAQGVMNYGLAVIRLYWLTVWPILDFRTLRARPEAAEVGWKDVVAAVLAIPAAVAGSAMLVSIMQLMATL